MHLGRFLSLPGHNARVALKSGDFTDIPDWAKPELTPVLDAGIAAGTDVHSEDKLRVNRVVVNCDEFYTAFGITEKDGMWVAPADRVKIW